MTAASMVNTDGEMAVLAAMLCERRVIDDLTDMLDPEDFSVGFFGHVFGLVTREHAAGRTVNPVTIKPQLEGFDDFAQLGGMTWLAGLTSSPLPILAAKGTARHIKELAERRRLVAGLTEAIEAANDPERRIEELVEVADQAVTAARDTGDDKGEFTGAAALDLVIDGFDQAVTGVECGVIPAIDSLLGPMRPTHMVVGAGRPGMGKTATAISYALGAASRGHGVLFISLEMGAEQLAERMAADLCLDKRIPYEAIRDRQLTIDQKREVCRARERLVDMPLQILDKQGLSISQVRTMVRRWARRFAARGQKLELVIVDYLQLLRADRGMDRYAAVTEISKSLKEIAKEQGLAVFALSQLSREVEKRGDRRPQLSDLRESGQIEQDADAVIFFLRHEYYLAQEGEPDPDDPRHRDWHKRMDACRGRIEFICAKRRNGQSGSRAGFFHGQYQAVRG